MKLSNELKLWRRKNSFTQAQAAEQLGTSLRTLQEWEQGRATPRGIALKAVRERIGR